MGIALDASGNLFVADEQNFQVLARGNGTGTVTLEAGGVGPPFYYGFNGDGRLGPSTLLSLPSDVAVNGAGDLFIVDTLNGRIRSGSALQRVVTVAGGYTGDGQVAQHATLGFQTNPWGGGIAFDQQGNLYIADTNDFRVRKVSASGIISTVAGTGITGYTGNGGLATKATLNGPLGVVVDELGNLFISNFGIMRKVDASGIITAFFHGPSQSASSGLATDASGNIYAADFGDCVVWKITPAGSPTIVAGCKASVGSILTEFPLCRLNFTTL